MSEKYIDLRQAIFSDLRDRGRPIAVSIGDVLEWLDEHPDQVPGRTITESEWSEYVNSTNGKYLAGADLLEKAGITVVPDPEPTNAEKLEALLEGGDINAQWGLRGGGVMFARELAHALDEAGVKAPGGDDDH